MRGSRNGLLIVLSEGMLLSWVYAWASFIMPMAGRRPFPLLDGALILALATMVSLLHRGRGWRVISIIALQAAAFLLAALRMVYVHFEWSHSFWSGEWVVTMLSQQRTHPGMVHPPAHSLLGRSALDWRDQDRPQTH